MKIKNYVYVRIYCVDGAKETGEDQSRELDEKKGERLRGGGVGNGKN